MDPTALFAALGQPSRLRCMLLLVRHGELCVCELTHALDLSQPYVSRHLALLRDEALVVARRAGQWIYYRLHPDLPPWAGELLATTAHGVLDEAEFAADEARLAAMPNRPGAACCA